MIHAHTGWTDHPWIVMDMGMFTCLYRVESGPRIHYISDNPWIVHGWKEGCMQTYGSNNNILLPLTIHGLTMDKNVYITIPNRVEM